MPILTVADLLSITTQADALNLEMQIAAALGLPTTAWEPLSPEMAILGVNSQIVATYSGDINLIAQGGFLSTAAKIPGTGTAVDGQGFSTQWADLVLLEVYNVLRNQPSFANGPVLVNVGNSGSTQAAGAMHFQNPITGATYTNVSSVTLTPFATNVSITLQADAPWPGSKGNAAQGTTLILLTPLPGVTVQPLVSPLVGTDIETNVSAGLRAVAKLGSLSPNGASQAYNFVATSVPTAATQANATFPFNALPFTVSAIITRVATILNTATGVVSVYIANSAGAPSGGDVTTIFNAIQAVSTPLAVTATVSAVGTLALNLVYNVFIPARLGLSAMQVKANIDAAIGTFCSTAPIGGFTGKTANIIPLDELIDVIMNANPGTTDLQMINPATDLPIATTSVPVPGTATVTNPACQVFFV